MKVITYLGFTLMSILIQFCVMDFIQERLQKDDLAVDVNFSSHKKHLSQILKDLKKTPHALYFQVNEKLRQRNDITTSASLKYLNSTVSSLSTSPSSVLSTTLIDVFYDENSTLVDNTMTTEEGLITTTEIENFTEITLFENKNKSAEKPRIEPKKNAFSTKCACDLLYQVCDINCCCDEDCSDDQVKLFSKCLSVKQRPQEQTIFCSDYSNNERVSLWVDNLFCIVKSNEPAKRKVNLEMYSKTSVDKALKMAYKWDEMSKPKQKESVFTENKQNYGDLIWLLKNRTLKFIELPFPSINDYCIARKPMNFLKEENIKCLVKLRDLEMFNIINITNDTKLISISSALNSSILNCSTLHCANLTVLVCDYSICTPYNKTIHEPMCTDKFCTGIALNIKYEIYYFDNKIVNGTVKLFTQKVSLEIPYMEQVISVKFYLANEHIDDIIVLSGNPGYLEGHPVIVSYEESNHTELFYSTKNVTKDKYWILPSNKQGLCDQTGEKRFVLFGQNIRKKCRVVFPHYNMTQNGSDLCKKLQTDILNLLRVSSKMHLSPLGNPHKMKDNDWIPLKKERFVTEVLYGEFETDFKLNCYNIFNRLSLEVAYADISEVDERIENTIINARLTGTSHNASFSVDDFSLVTTLDISFIDLTKPPKYKYAASPNLHIHLPRDFFFPFPSNACSKRTYSFVFVCALALLVIK